MKERDVVILGDIGAFFPGELGPGLFKDLNEKFRQGASGITPLKEPITIDGRNKGTITRSGRVEHVGTPPYPRDKRRHSKKGIDMTLFAGKKALDSTGLPLLPDGRVDTGALGIVRDRFASWGASGYGDAEANNGFHETFLKVEWRDIFAMVLEKLSGIAKWRWERFTTESLRNIGTRAIQASMPNGPSSTFAICCGAEGEGDTSSTACSSSLDAFGNMFRLIQWDIADLGFVTAMDTLANRYYTTLFGLASALSRKKNESLPFGKERDGFILSEGAMVTFLAELEFVKRNNLEEYILAQVVGYGASCDAHDMTFPKRETGVKAVQKSLDQARKEYGVSLEEIAYWCAHGTSTGPGDLNESEIIDEIFANLTILVSSVKRMIGHMIGPAGLANIAAAAYACKYGRIVGMGNYELDPKCMGKKAEIRYVMQNMEREIRAAIATAFGFGGHNASIVLRRYEG